MQQYDTQALLEFASGLARQAGEVMRRYFYGDDMQVTTKADNSPVTVADTTINRMLIEAVAERFPEYGVLGEEASAHADRRELWVCDPIDGTRGFIHGDPTAMFSLAFVVDGEPLLAVAYDPFQDRLFTAVKGRGAQCNGTALHVSDQSPQGAVIAGPGSLVELERGLEVYRDLRRQGMQVRLMAGGVFKMCLIASGRLDGRIFPGCFAHDLAAAKLIVEEAGGMVTDLRGAKQRYDGEICGAIISNGVIHDVLVAAVKKAGVDNILGYGV